jgi:ABC-type phosphate transport system substrate-binding protein
MRPLLLIVWLASAALASDYSVIVSKKVSLSAVTSQQVRDVYLQKRHTIGDQTIIPVNLVGQNELRSAFESTVLGMDRNRLNAYWIKQHFQGNTPPLTQPSVESIKLFVQNVEGAMGYIPSAMADNSVRVVYEF